MSLERLTLVEESDFAFEADARGLVDMLLSQFNDPLLAFREIIQNSLDERPSKIEINTSYDPGRKLFCASVEDDGNGMDLDRIRSYLKLFDSSKEHDIDTIGEMGVGRIFAYALDPKYIIVETGDGETGHKLVLRHDCSGQLKKSEVRKGTKVSIILEKSEKRDAEYFDKHLRDSIKENCGLIKIPLNFNGVKINRNFGTKAKHSIDFEEQNIRGVISVASQAGNYEICKGGILLSKPRRLSIRGGWDNDFPGSNVRLDSMHFNQPLSRNAVVEDGN